MGMGACMGSSGVGAGWEVEERIGACPVFRCPFTSFFVLSSSRCCLSNRMAHVKMIYGWEPFTPPELGYRENFVR